MLVLVVEPSGVVVVLVVASTGGITVVVSGGAIVVSIVVEVSPPVEVVWPQAASPIKLTATAAAKTDFNMHCSPGLSHALGLRRHSHAAGSVNVRKPSRFLGVRTLLVPPPGCRNGTPWQLGESGL